ncbi:hypothetical protein CPC735_062320 [Coccidioides posadasii C735 delta SOWgp]|uniref:Cyclin-D1-binding protein 1-like N-terminal domain-containing protein n=1 Tax=Coccidioides posadasii (strain C735) TaxID=222929 RepID=C5P3U1_COCP7|nr:hypothetical protein CPC735_062320 [Coccidioides posadasii C735 delta SOWgp]EER28359.1 hypothetical protein CPC735_062320 [Coccidioides posadasii C735 delta SOWgp]|eukprot:XP_003070504.1 hypothetical protein CPC735_062320 [Coccidioides posadasii C735 delta SOWgp]
MPPSLLKALDTTLALSEQFSLNLSSPNASESAACNASCSDPQTSPLPLLSAASHTLKAQTTKLSLLAINAPFTPSAIVTVLTDVNDAVLPSLTTAALLSVPEKYTQTFSTEAKALVKDALRELTTLIQGIRAIAVSHDKHKEFTLSGTDKNGITAATARVWEVCDHIINFASEGVVGLVVRKAKEYLELVKDGIRELKEWDPEEDLDGDDGFWVEDFGDEAHGEANGGVLGKGKAAKSGDEEEEHMEDEDKDENDENQRAKLEDEKKCLLRLLTLVSQLYTAIISYRLKNLDEKAILPKFSPKLDSVASCLQDLPNLVDEAAGSLYEHNLEFSDAYSLRLRDRASEAVDLLCEPWVLGATLEQGDLSRREDKFSKWATVWIKVVEGLGNDRLQPEG